MQDIFCTSFLCGNHRLRAALGSPVFRKVTGMVIDICSKPCYDTSTTTRGVRRIARPQKCRCICSAPRFVHFSPEDGAAAGTVVLGYDEYEVLRLLDYEGFSQAMCAQRMDVSRTTVTRMYESARKKVSDALVNGKSILMEPGDVVVCPAPKPECAGVRHCCHRRDDTIL